MRGQRIYEDLIGKRYPGRGQRKGRSNDLLAKRNELMLSRYYYYGHYKGYLLPEIIKQLETEFFLAPHTISNIIANNANTAMVLKEQGIVLFRFRARWPHLRW